VTTIETALNQADNAGPVSDLLARVRDTIATVKAGAAQGEKDRRVPDETIAALEEAGAFLLMAPTRSGGYGGSMRSLLDLGSLIGQGDGATAWVVTILNTGAWLTGHFPLQAQEEVYGGDPNAKISGVLATTGTTRKVDGGWMVSGKWFYNSGSWHATWAIVGAPLRNEQGEEIDHALMLLPMSEAKIEDTWFVAGMQATGSNCLVVDDIFVPEHRVISAPAAIRGKLRLEDPHDPIYDAAFIGYLALAVVGPLLGMGRAALDIIVDKAPKKPISYTFFESQADSVAVQLQIAEAAMTLDTAFLHAYRAAEDIDSAVLAGTYPDRFVRSRIRADVGYVSEKILRVIELALSVHGAGSFANVNALQRIWRDASTGARHAMITPTVGYELLAKAMLNRPERITPMI
jgi:alkylation response protein AidB-like acyl-CoA dehydrogenase